MSSEILRLQSHPERARTGGIATARSTKNSPWRLRAPPQPQSPIRRTSSPRGGAHASSSFAHFPCVPSALGTTRPFLRSASRLTGFWAGRLVSPACSSLRTG